MVFSCATASNRAGTGCLKSSSAQGFRGNNALEFHQYPLAQTCDPPAHHSVKVRCRSLPDPLRQCQAGPVPGGASAGRGQCQAGRVVKDPRPDATLVQPIQETAPMTRPAHRNCNTEVDFRGEKRSNPTHASVTDPDARLFWRAPGAGDAVLHGAYMDG